MNSFSLAFVLTILIFLSFSISTEAVSKKLKWNDKKVNELEKEWEEGDDEYETLSEVEYNKKIAKEKSKVNFNDPDAIAKSFREGGAQFTTGKDGGGQKMMFVDLTETQADGSPWTKAALDKLASYMQMMIRSGSNSADVYGLDDNKLLVSVTKAWMIRDVIKFLVRHKDVVKVALDNVDYTTKNFANDDDADDDDDEDDEDDEL